MRTLCIKIETFVLTLGALSYSPSHNTSKLGNPYQHPSSGAFYDYVSIGKADKRDRGGTRA